MAVYEEGRYISLISDTDLSATTNGVPTDLFRIVSIASSTANPTNRTIALSTSATDTLIIGVLNNAPKAGETASVVGRNAEGTFKVVINGTVAIGDKLTTDSTSAAITTTTSGNQVIGVALEAGVAGQVIEYIPTGFMKYT